MVETRVLPPSILLKWRGVAGRGRAGSRSTELYNKVHTRWRAPGNTLSPAFNTVEMARGCGAWSCGLALDGAVQKGAHPVEGAGEVPPGPAALVHDAEAGPKSVPDSVLTQKR